jgi:transcriptional regulator with XRE-family HTH domain
MGTGNKEPNEYRGAIASLKQALKSRGFTYRELAEGIGLSESGVKKIFAAHDGSFQRIAQICRYIGVSLSELIEDNRMMSVEFSAQQQKEFLKDPMIFHFYWLLVYERRPLTVVQKELKLSKTEAFRLARRLDDLSLIKLLPGERLRLPSIKAVRWTGDGEFLRSIYRQWSRSMVEDLAKPEVQKENLFILRYLQMSQKTYVEFQSALRTIEEEFVRRAIYEMRTRPTGLEHVRWLVVADNRSFVTG